MLEVFEIGEDIKFLADTRQCNVEPIDSHELSWSAHEAEYHCIGFLSLALIDSKDRCLYFIPFSLVNAINLELELTLLVFVLKKFASLVNSAGYKINQRTVSQSLPV